MEKTKVAMLKPSIEKMCQEDYNIFTITSLRYQLCALISNLEALINILPYWLNLDYFSIVRLSTLILSLSICVYLFSIKGRSITTLLLAWTFAGASIFNLFTFLEFVGNYYWQPPVPVNLILLPMQNIGPSIALVSLLLFAYYFPRFRKAELKESKIILSLSVLLNLVTFGLTVYNFFFLEWMRSYFHFRMAYYIILYIVVGSQFILIISLLFRRAIRLSTTKSQFALIKLFKAQGKDSLAARSLALILLLPLGTVFFYLLMTLGILPPAATTYLVWLVFSLFYFSFVLTYLNHTTDPTTFQVKLVGITLITILGIIGLAAIFVGKSYERDYKNEKLIQDRQTIHFARNTLGSYDISGAPYSFNTGLGKKIDLDYGKSRRLRLPFPFPYFDHVFHEVHVLHGPMIYLGQDIKEDGWGGYDPQPVIAPILMNLNPAEGGGVFVRKESERLTITWYELPEFGSANKNTIQLVLAKDGSFDITYKELDPHLGYSAAKMFVYLTANLAGIEPGARSGTVPFGPKLIGIHPGNKGAALKPIRFSDDLPFYSKSPEVIFEAYDIDYYRYIHSRMSVLAVILLVSSIFVLFFFPILLKTSLIKPLHALYEGMMSANKGNLEISVSPQFNDEIGFLTKSFNRMLQNIRKAESNFRSLAENSQDGILIILGKNVPVYANKQVSDISGYTNAELMKISFNNLIRNEEKQSTKNYETLLKTKIESFVPVELTHNF